MSGRGRKSFTFYNQIDEILGTRAALQPPLLLESGGAEGSEEAEREVGGSDVAPELFSLSYPVQSMKVCLEMTLEIITLLVNQLIAMII